MFLGGDSIRGASAVDANLLGSPGRTEGVARKRLVVGTFVDETWSLKKMMELWGVNMS